MECNGQSLSVDQALESSVGIGIHSTGTSRNCLLRLMVSNVGNMTLIAKARSSGSLPSQPIDTISWHTNRQLTFISH